MFEKKDNKKQFNIEVHNRNLYEGMMENKNKKQEMFSSPLSPLKKYTVDQKVANTSMAKNFKENNINKDGKHPKMKFAMKTKAGCTVNKTTKTNQDCPIVNPKILSDIDYSFFAVCDGHGVNGHHVSGKIKQSLPKNLYRFLKTDDNLSNNDVKNALMRSFYHTNQEVFAQEYDCNLSGSTTISCLIKDNKVWCANVGDSRAIIIKYKNGEYKPVPLSTDHKPCLERERIRVQKAGGRIDTQKDMQGQNIGPLRVWLQNLEIPGLAMTRSLGDKIGVQAGVSGDPEIFETDLSEEDRFMVLASDGVFEYMSNQECCKFILPYYEKNQPELAAEKIVAESTNKWKQESWARDDITCIVIFFQNNSN